MLIEYAFLEAELRHPTAFMLLKRPPGNLLHIDMMEEMNRALLAPRADPALERLILRGAGGVFCEGLDLREHVKDRLQRLFQVYSRLFETIRMVDVVSIAAAEGRASGSGFSWRSAATSSWPTKVPPSRCPMSTTDFFPHRVYHPAMGGDAPPWNGS